MVCKRCTSIRLGFGKTLRLLWASLIFAFGSSVKRSLSQGSHIGNFFDKINPPALFYAGAVLTLLALGITLVGCTTRFDGELTKTRNSQPQGGENEKSDRSPPKPTN
jgi:hypothetical protein